MRTVGLIAFSLLAFGCAHQQTSNLAQRQSETTPRSDFDAKSGDNRRERPMPPVEPPIVTSPVP